MALQQAQHPLPAGAEPPAQRDAIDAPLVVHIVYRLAVGGLENSLVNLINLMPAARYRHAVVCLTDYTDYRDRIRRPDVPTIAINKSEGQDPGAYWRLWKLMRRLRPAIVHTRTLGALEGNLYAALAHVPGRVHGEHSQSIYNSRLRKFRHTVLRKAIHPLVHHYTTVNNDLADWLVNVANVPRQRVTRIYNGVDTNRFHPNGGSRAPLGPPGFSSAETMVIGTVGRMQPVKDQVTLVRGFLHALESFPGARKRLRLVLVGDGPVREPARDLLRAANALDIAWLPGERADVAEIMRGLDVFVLPSLSEGTSNTILEAMASGLPVIATRVGGNPELVGDGSYGFLTPPADPAAISNALGRYLENPGLRIAHGHAARSIAQASFSMESMINGYMTVYDTVLHRITKR